MPPSTRARPEPLRGVRPFALPDEPVMADAEPPRSARFIAGELCCCVIVSRLGLSVTSLVRSLELPTSSGSAASKTSRIPMSPKSEGDGSERKSVGEGQSSIKSVSSGESASANQASSLRSSWTAVFSACTFSPGRRERGERRVAPPGAVPHSRRRALKSWPAPALTETPRESEIPEPDDTKAGRVAALLSIAIAVRSRAGIISCSQASAWPFKRQKPAERFTLLKLG